MRVRIDNRAGLADAATWVARNLRLRSTEPVYGGALLTTTPGGLVVEGFDTTTATRFQIPAEVAEAGSVLVSARLLAEVARLLPNHPVDLDATGGGELAAACGSSRARLPLMPVEDYPQRPAAATVSWWCEAESLASEVVRVAAAASSDPGTPALTCVVLDLPAGGEPLRLYATDRASLATARMPAEPTGPDVDGGRVLVTAAALEPAVRALAGDPGRRIGFGTDGSVLVLETATRRITLATLDCEAPDFERVLSAAAGCEFVAPRAEFEAALKRVSLHKDAPKARIDCAANELRIGVRGQHGTSQETLAVDYTGEPVAVGMFTHRLAAALHHVGGDLAHFTVPAAPNRPWLLRPVADDGAPDDTYRHMVIPAKLLDGEEAAA
ncbi:hypothetical protein AB0L13_20185 [Saccharopolyspora shandongensis]|uniref:DNA polymerase III subunit beta n=1 Tax=Saccharopolyspora shandongensis TaxID=418495 RepID=UPI0034431B0C